MFWLTTFAKSQRCNHECRSCDLPDAPLGGIGRPVLASIVNRSSFLISRIGDLLLGDDIPQDLKCAGPDLEKTIRVYSLVR